MAKAKNVDDDQRSKRQKKVVVSSQSRSDVSLVGAGAGSEFIDIGILNDCYPNCDLFGSEEKVAKAAWLKRLAYTLVGMEKRTAAWKAVRSVCYSQPLLDNLYLFTSHDISLYERNQEASCVLKKELKPLIKRYKSLSEDLNILVNRQDFQSIIVYRRALIEQLEMLNKATVELEILRDVTVKSGDVEMNAKDHYLYIMAAIVRSETGSLRLAELATLIEAGCLAHGHQDPFLSAGDISKRLLRFRTRRKLRLTAKGEPWYKCFSR